MKNKLIQIFIAAILPVAGISQASFYNQGSDIYVQKGALVEVQGAFVNTNGSANGSVANDGIIEVQGDFENDSNAIFTVYNDNTSTDRAVKFVGGGTQHIIGQMNVPGSASFYNLVVDMAAASDTVQMQANTSVQGSLVFGTSTTTTTYNPSNLYTNNNEKGLVQTYNGSTEYALNVVNSNTDAIAGYPSMMMSGAPATGYVLTSGIRGSSNGGLQRSVTSATSYDYPIGTAEHGFNAVRMNFTSVPSGGGLVTGKFNDGSDNPDGSVGAITQQCIGCTSDNPTPDNDGFNQYFSNDPCNGGAPQWLIMQDAILGHGYWSFASADGNQNYNYSIEVFPNSFTMEGNTTDAWRTLMYPGAYGLNPSGAGTDWNQYIDSVSSTDDLMTYTKNTGNCYTGDGIPGGIYSGFGQFTMKKGNGGGALPVTLLSLAATPQSQAINVNWSTGIEINNAGFHVERSTDGVNFNTIGWVNGHDNSTVQQNYIYTDINVEPNTVYYYRLSQVDNNGYATLSYTVSAEITGGTDFAISDPMPNPASASSNIVVSSSVSQPIAVKVYTILGQLVSNEDVTINAGSNTLTLNVQALASGSYSAVIEASGKSYSKILVVSK